MPKGHTVSKYIMTQENVNHLSVREKSQIKKTQKTKKQKWFEKCDSNSISNILKII